MSGCEWRRRLPPFEVAICGHLCDSRPKYIQEAPSFTLRKGELAGNFAPAHMPALKPEGHMEAVQQHSNGLF